MNDPEIYCNFCGTPSTKYPQKKCERTVICQNPPLLIIPPKDAGQILTSSKESAKPEWGSIQ